MRLACQLPAQIVAVWSASAAARAVVATIAAFASEVLQYRSLGDRVQTTACGSAVSLLILVDQLTNCSAAAAK